MDIKLYDANFETTGKVIDTFSSLSYTDRWNADGDFKLVLPVGEYNTVKDAKYLAVNGRTFEISQINTADTSASNELTIAGHNLNVLLDRVVIGTPARIQGNLETSIRALVSDYAITGYQSVPKLVLGALKGYARAIDANAPRGSLGDFLYTELNKRGFSFELNYDPAVDEITFDIVQSKDRTEDQTENVQAVFSAQKENLENMEYERNETEYYNCAVVCDEDPTNPQTAIVDLSNGAPKRTVYIKASSVYEDTENPPLFVAVGSSGYIGTSTDGIEYTQGTSGTTENLWGVDYQNGVFIVCGSNGKILTSTDAVTWVPRTSGITDAIEGARYIDGAYIFGGANGKILTSYNDFSFSVFTDTYGRKFRGFYAIGNEFIALGAETTSLVSNNEIVAYRSGDAFNWNLIQHITLDAAVTRAVTFDLIEVEGNLLSVGFILKAGVKIPIIIKTSNSEIEFSVTELTSKSGYEFRAAVYGNGVIVAIGQPNLIMWSDDGGDTWNDCSPADSIDYIALSFDGTNFFAYGGATRKVAISTTGKSFSVYSTSGFSTSNIDSSVYGAAQRQYSLYSIGYNALQSYKAVELVSGDLLPTARPKIGVDCNVGDIVDIVDKERGIIVSKILSEAQTVYERDKNGIIYPNFGDGYLNLKKYIKKEVDKRG